MMIEKFCRGKTSVSYDLKCKTMSAVLKLRLAYSWNQRWRLGGETKTPTEREG